MRNAGGYAVITSADHSVVNFDGLRRERVTTEQYEVDTFTCFHCNRVEHVPAKADVNAVGFCRNCMRPICSRCANEPCQPFEHKLLEVEARDRTRRQYAAITEERARAKESRTGARTTCGW